MNRTMRQYGPRHHRVGDAVRRRRCIEIAVVLLFGMRLAHSAEPVFEVVSPLGEDTVKMSAMAPRLDTLAGKTVCMIGNDAFKINVTMPAIAEALRAQYAGLRIVPYTELPQAEPGAPQVLPPSIHDEFRSKGCDAVISGNGG